MDIAVDTNELGAAGYYFNKLWGYWSNKCTQGEITEEQMEDKIDRIENMSARQRKAAWRRLT